MVNVGRTWPRLGLACVSYCLRIDGCLLERSRNEIFVSHNGAVVFEIKLSACSVAMTKSSRRTGFRLIPDRKT